MTLPRLLSFAVLLTFALPILAGPDEPRDKPVAAAPGPASRAGDPVIVWNRTITVFRAPIDQFTPAQRAAMATARIEALPEVGEWQIEAQ